MDFMQLKINEDYYLTRTAIHLTKWFIWNANTCISMIILNDLQCNSDVFFTCARREFLFSVTILFFRRFVSMVRLFLWIKIFAFGGQFECVKNTFYRINFVNRGCKKNYLSSVNHSDIIEAPEKKNSYACRWGQMSRIFYFRMWRYA